MPIKVEIRMDAESMADFMVYHIYTSMVGILTLALGFLNVGCALAFLMRGNLAFCGMFLAFAVVILAVFPYLIRRKVGKQMQNSKRLNIPVTYEFDDTGIVTTTPDDSGKASWKKFKKAVSRKRILILYDEKKQAIILPIEQLREEYAAVVECIYRNMPAPAVRIHRPHQKKS